MDDETLRQTYRRMVEREGSTDRRGCPDPERLFGLVDRSDPEATRLETLDHAMACPECRKELDLIRAMGAGDEEATPRTRSRIPIPRFAAAASILLVAGGALTVWNVQLRSNLDPAFRGTDTVTLISPAEEIAPGGTTTFVWHPAEGASEYRVELIDGDGAVLASATTADSTVSIPVPALAPDAPVYWSVQTTLRTGAVVRSPAVPLTVR